MVKDMPMYLPYDGKKKEDNGHSRDAGSSG